MLSASIATESHLEHSTANAGFQNETYHFSQRERSAKLAREYSGDVPYFPPSVRQEVGKPLWAVRSPLPPINPNPNTSGGPISMRDTEKCDGTYMDGVNWSSEKINSHSDMSYAVQVS